MVTAATNYANGIDQWHALVTRRGVKIARVSLALLAVGAGALFWRPLDQGLPYFSLAMGLVALWCLWLAVRPASMDPFIRAMQQPETIARSYVHEHYVNGGYSHTKLTMELKSGKLVFVTVPQGEGFVWQDRLKELLPNVEHRNAVPPGGG